MSEGCHSSFIQEHGDDFISMPPLDVKIGVECENLSGRVYFRESHQTGICQGHGPAAIPAHERSQIRLLRPNSERDTNHAPLQ